VALNALKFYPAPNTDVGPFFRNNYFIDSPETNTANGMIGKLDQSLRERHRVTVELAFSNGTLGAATVVPHGRQSGPSNRDFQTRRGSLEYVFTASSRTVNTLTFEANSNVSASGDTAGPDQLRRPDGPHRYRRRWFSGNAIGPLRGHGAGLSLFAECAQRLHLDRWPLHQARQAHAAGDGTVYRQQVNSFWPQYPAGLLSFDQGLTSLPGIVDTGDALATFLLGTPYFAEETIDTQPSYFRRSEGSLAFRDRYEAMKGLTINVGLTTHLFTPRTEKYDRQSNIDLSAINPANGLPGALVVAGAGRFRRRVPADAGAPGAQPGHRLESAGTTRRPWCGRISRAITRAFRSIPDSLARKGSTSMRRFFRRTAQLQPALTMRTGVPAPALPARSAAGCGQQHHCRFDRYVGPGTHLSIGVAIDRAGVPGIGRGDHRVCLLGRQEHAGGQRRGQSQCHSAGRSAVRQ
jgi:hypothetical protein